MNKIKERQIEIVRELVKKPKVILEEMTERKCAILHPMLGIVGEVFELWKALRDRLNNIEGARKNIIEEMGDLFFYIIDMKIVLGALNRKLEDEPLPVTDDEIMYCLEHSSGDLLDLVKKFAVYNIKLVDRPAVKKDEISIETLIFLTLRIEYSLDCIIKGINLDEDEIRLDEDDIRQHNIDKLRDGPNPRYPKGYSDASASERADKTKV